MKMNNTHRHPIKLVRLFGISILFSVLIFGANTVLAQCGPVNCVGTTGSGKNCTVMATLTCGFTATTVFSNGFTNMSTNANCGIVGPVTGMATHTISQGTPASCSFYFSLSCAVMGTGTTGPTTMTYPLFADCSIGTADGLPVELMGFEIQD